MAVRLLVAWTLGVAVFFFLWAILAKVVKHISEKREKKKKTKNNNTQTF